MAEDTLTKLQQIVALQLVQLGNVRPLSIYCSVVEGLKEAFSQS